MSRIIWDRVQQHDTLRQQPLGFPVKSTAARPLHDPQEGNAAPPAKVRRVDAGGARRSSGEPGTAQHTHGVRFAPGVGGGAKPPPRGARAPERPSGGVSRPHRTSIDTALVAEGVLGPGYTAINPRLFAGLSLQFDPGILFLKEEVTVYHLELVVKHFGGQVAYFPRPGVTHIVCSNLAAGKMNAVQKRAGRGSSGAPVVTPEWILACLRGNRRLSEAAYGLVGVRNAAEGAAGGQPCRAARPAGGRPRARTLQSMAPRKHHVIVL